MEKPRPLAADWLVGGGEMGALIRAKDWSKTPLGPIDTWPQSLRSAVSILLPSKAQIVLFWGPELVAIYNDAYRPVFGSKHPAALGMPARKCWSEVWDVLEPLFRNVVNTGEAFWAKDHLFGLERHGYVEETYFDVSYDPVRDETGRVGGLFCIVSETTGRIIGERRLARSARSRARRQWSVIRGAMSSATRPRCSSATARTCRSQPSTAGMRKRASAHLEAVTGIAAGNAGAPEQHRLDEPRRSWPVGSDSEMMLADRVADVAARWAVAGAGEAGGGPEDRQPPAGAVWLSRPRHQRAAQFDDDYRDFLQLAGANIAERHRRRAGAGGRAPARRRARRARPREDGVLQQRQPRVPDAAHPDARAAGGPSGEDRRATAAGKPRAAHSSAAQRPAAAQAGQHAARLRAHRSRAHAGSRISRPTCAI